MGTRQRQQRARKAPAGAEPAASGAASLRLGCFTPVAARMADRAGGVSGSGQSSGNMRRPQQVSGGDGQFLYCALLSLGGVALDPGRVFSMNDSCRSRFRHSDG